VVTFIGLLSKRKGVLDLVDTADIVAKKFPNVKFVITGAKEGAIYARIQDLLKQKQLENNFTFLGFREDIQDVITCSDVITIPSLVEPCSLIALEAMQLGRPVVATRSGGHEETLLDGETGILVHPITVFLAILCLYSFAKARSITKCRLQIHLSTG